LAEDLNYSRPTAYLYKRHLESRVRMPLQSVTTNEQENSVYATEFGRINSIITMLTAGKSLVTRTKAQPVEL
jgi:hypothetical protein